MEKFRIKRVGLKYYPQVKKSLFWENITLPKAILYNSNNIGTVKNAFFRKCHENINSSHEFLYIVNEKQVCDNIVSAQEAVSQYKNLMKPFKYKKHKIIQTVNGEFVDMSSNVFFIPYSIDEFYMYANFSYEIDGIKKIVDDFEYYWNIERKTKKTFMLTDN